VILVSYTLIKLCTRLMPKCWVILLSPFKGRNGLAQKAIRKVSGGVDNQRFKHWRKHRTALRNYLEIHMKVTY